MQVREIMTDSPASVNPSSSLQDAAEKMRDHDCGALPVVDGEGRSNPMGIITDRDITVRVVARGDNPLQGRVKDAMTETAVTVKQDADIQEAEQLMEQEKIRRIIVVNDSGECVGIVSQADLALRLDEEEAGEVVEEVSEPSRAPSEAAS